MAEYWGCPNCFTIFDSGRIQDYCHYCEEFSVVPVRRDSYTRGFVNPSDFPCTNLECEECGNPKLCTGGSSKHDLQMRGWCTFCIRETDTIFADGHEAFCCVACRAKRELVYHASYTNPSIDARVFSQYCDVCEQITDTGKVDSQAKSVWCCDLCRAEWAEGVDGGCKWCGDEDGEVQEIDDYYEDSDDD